MKTGLFVITALLLISCSNQYMAETSMELDSNEIDNIAAQQTAEFNTLIEKARWGDGQAYLKLADCYRDGIGVKQDFLGMMYMVFQAVQHGGIEDEGCYFNSLPSDDEYKQCIDVMCMSSSQLRNACDSILQQLTAIDDPDVLAVRGIVTMESGDTIGGMRLIDSAADNGSAFAEILRINISEKRDEEPDKDKLLQIAERVPVVYKNLAMLCLQRDENGDIDEPLAAYYFLKAEEKAMLGKRDARWLLDYYNDGGDIQLTAEGVERLEAFIGSNRKDYEVVVADTICIDDKIRE